MTGKGHRAVAQIEFKSLCQTVGEGASGGSFTAMTSLMTSQRPFYSFGPRAALSAGGTPTSFSMLVSRRRSPLHPVSCAMRALRCPIVTLDLRNA